MSPSAVSPSTQPYDSMYGDLDPGIESFLTAASAQTPSMMDPAMAFASAASSFLNDSPIMSSAVASASPSAFSRSSLSASHISNDFPVLSFSETPPASLPTSSDTDRTSTSSEHTDSISSGHRGGHGINKGDEHAHINDKTQQQKARRRAFNETFARIRQVTATPTNLCKGRAAEYILEVLLKFSRLQEEYKQLVETTGRLPSVLQSTSPAKSIADPYAWRLNSTSPVWDGPATDSCESIPIAQVHLLLDQLSRRHQKQQLVHTAELTSLRMQVSSLKQAEEARHRRKGEGKLPSSSPKPGSHGGKPSQARSRKRARQERVELDALEIKKRQRLRAMEPRHLSDSDGELINDDLVCGGGSERSTEINEDEVEDSDDGWISSGHGSGHRPVTKLKAAQHISRHIRSCSCGLTSSSP